MSKNKGEVKQYRVYYKQFKHSEEEEYYHSPTTYRKALGYVANLRREYYSARMEEA